MQRNVLPTLRHFSTFSYQRSLALVSSEGELFPEIKKKISRYRVKGKDLEAHPEKGWIFQRESVYRELLDDAFGSGNWELRAHEPFQINWMSMTRNCGLYVSDTLVASAKGDVPLDESSIKQLEGIYEKHLQQKQEVSSEPLQVALKEAVPFTLQRWCEFVALLRCCKEIGMATELWDREISQQHLETECIRVHIDGVQFSDFSTYKLQGALGSQRALSLPDASAPKSPPRKPSRMSNNPNRLKYFWRRRDASPFANEIAVQKS